MAKYLNGASPVLVKRVLVKRVWIKIVCLRHSWLGRDWLRPGRFRVNLALSCGLLALLLGLNACQEAPEQAYDWHLPVGFPEPLVPQDNPMSSAKVDLGKALFFSQDLSFNQQQSCASCHQPNHAFSEGLTTAIGSSGQTLRRNTLALVNVAYNSTLTWAHSGLTRIEQQILIPMFNEDPIELGITGHESAVLARFQTPQYATLFTEAFGDNQVNFDRIVKALASFVRSLTSFNSAFDRYAYQGDDQALSASAIRGMDLFFSERLECFHCHGGFNFTQSSQHQNQRLDLRPFHNTGLYNEDGQGAYPQQDQGLIEVTLQDHDMGHFRAPTLRNVALSAPYMHDGSLTTLQEVIAFYAAGGRGPGMKSPIKDAFIQGFSLTADEQNDLLNFLQSLTDEQFGQSFDTEKSVNGDIVQSAP
jgi:cytochrome c peroxidase